MSRTLSRSCLRTSKPIDRLGRDRSHPVGSGWIGAVKVVWISLFRQLVLQLEIGQQGAIAVQTCKDDYCCVAGIVHVSARVAGRPCR